MAAVWVVVVASIALGYTYLGYPLLVALLASLRRPRRSRSGDGPLGRAPLVTAVIPVWNGAATIVAKIESLLGQDYPTDRLEILIYCDGCTDETETLARTVATQPAARGRVRVLAGPVRRGKPTGLNRMLADANGELVLFGDARQTLAPGSVRALAVALADPRVGCATGRLRLAGEAGSGVYWRYEEWIRRSESAFRGVVGMTGPIAMIRRDDFEPLPEDLILDDVWLPMRLCLGGRRVVLVPEAIAFDRAAADRREFGRKVRTLAGNYQLFARMPKLLSPFVNPLWFETVSHKVLRLLAPWWLLALGAASVAGSAVSGERRLMRTVVGLELVFYLAAACGRRGGRLAGLARTFVVMNSAAIVGLWRAMTGRQRVTW